MAEVTEDQHRRPPYVEDWPLVILAAVLTIAISLAVVLL